MTLKQIAALGKKLVSFLALFADCFARQEGRSLLAVYVKGQLSDLHRKKTTYRTRYRFAPNGGLATRRPRGALPTGT